MQTFIIKEIQAGQRFDKFLRKYLPAAPDSFLYKMLRKKNITLNGKKADGKEILSPGDVVESYFSEETFSMLSGLDGNRTAFTNQGTNISGNKRIRPFVHTQYEQAYRNLKSCGIDILYEDADLLIVNKPTGILTQKAKENDYSLNEWLIGYLLEQGGVSKEDLNTFRPSVCNRLDRNTSGIVLCGKTLAGLQFFSEIIRTKEVKKFYRTICVGNITENQTLEGTVFKDHKINKVTIHEKNTGENKFSSERISYIKTALYPICHEKGYTYIEVQLFTGKTHQIRAHLAETGHPLIGDGKYGDKQINQLMREKFGLNHQLLHAYRLEFPAKMQGKFQNKFSYMEDKVIIADFPANFDKIKQEIFNL